MSLSFPSDCPSCGSTDKPFKLIQRETEQDFIGEIYHVTSPALECRHCGSITLGPGHAEALRQAVHDAYRERHHLNRSHPTHREMNLLRSELNDLGSARDRLIQWLSNEAPRAQQHKKEHQDRLLSIIVREQKLSQEFEELANLRGEEFERLTQKIKQLDSEIITHTAKLKEVHALLGTQENNRKQAELRAKKAESEAKDANSELKSLNRSIAKFEKKIESLKPGTEEFERKIERLNSRLATEKEKRKTAESDLEEKTSEIDDLNRSISANERDFRNLESRHAREQGLLERERFKAEKLRQELEAAIASTRTPKVSEAALKRAERSLGEKDRKLKEAHEKIEVLISQSNLESVFHLTDERLIRWLSSEIEGRGWTIPDQATMLGEGPILWNQMFAHLREWDCAPYLNGCEWIIVGRQEWTPEKLDELIAEREGKDIKIVSQELFLAAVISGHDPFMADEEVLLAFAEGHPALEYLRDAGFEWPFSCEWIDEEPEDSWFIRAEISPLKAMGYTVGERGLYEDDRRDILTNAFEGELEWVESQEYMDLWGSPGSRHRLRRMVYHIARQIPMHSGMGHDTAVYEWAKDLDWLYDEFYKPWMRFRWPGSEED